ncbi:MULTISPECIES: GAF domain-containing protein [Vibrio]|uniref:GAF domain-containing protein n=1 Tax=Vibrio casei TaxID=673372 RepID=A0A368LN38_9VIBR|nr:MULTISPECIES: GAF domain-containing protein [Vibrio]RCS73225.1 GAF domain-containing protein [Vibrio casei]SJN18718.1 Free methionine-(R)-sulfoxide reductase, contains GAF domain [Vibrio casei]HBV76010.1 GAF domain-containing protein [Vibrio sp.]
MSLKMYQRITAQVNALIESEPDLIANLANISALLKLELEDINWVGFYLLKNDELVLGPFQGNPACVRIPVGRGVCGTAISENRVQRIEDVHQFEGHIACDAQSNSELVIPFSVNNQLVGVIDIDSPTIGRFSEVDEKGMVELMKQVELVLQTHI